MIQPSLQIGGGEWAVKETKLLGTNPVLNEKLPVEIDVTNATIGTRVNKEGIIEKGPRNLLTYSEDFSNAVWSKANISVNSNSIIAPDGTLTADKMTATTSDSYLQRTGFSFNSGDILTYSFYIKAVDIGFDSQVKFYDGTQNTNIAFTVTNEWQRVSRTFTASNTASYQFWIGGNGTLSIGENFYLWGAQVEQSSEATEYYPTTTRTDLARVDYSSGEAVLLIEPQRTNLILQSEDYTSSSWVKTEISVTPNSILSPDGFLTADLISGSSINTRHFINQNLSQSAKTLSVFAKYGNHQFIQILTSGNANPVANYDILNGTANMTGLNSTASIQNYGNGWFRCILTTTETNAGDFFICFSISLTDTRLPTTPGSLNIYLWGGMSENGAAFASSYIPTLASAVTRNADVISKTGISDLINSEEGTFFVDARVFADDGVNRVISLSDGTGSNRISITFHITSRRIQVVSTKAGGILFNLEILTAIKTNFNKIALVFNNNSAKFFINGVLIQQSPITSSYAVGTLTKLSFDAGTLSVLPFDGQVQSLQIYKTALTDAQSITLTTL